MRDMEKRVDLLESKIDFIVNELKLQKEHRDEIKELKDDFNRVLKTLFNSVTEELEDVSENLKTGTFISFLKKLLRNLNNITKLLEQMESLEDFINDFSPLTKTISVDIMNNLEKFEKKGYFNFMNNMMMIMDKIIMNFEDSDFGKITDIVDKLSSIIKKVLTGGNLNKVNKFIDSFNTEEVPEKVSVYKLFKEINSDESRKILYRFIHALRETEKTINKEE
jgi:methyl-accepting chemotaxis protein